MLPCVLLTLSIFFFLAYLHPFSHLTILFIPAWLRVCLSRAYHRFSQDPWEKCRSAVQCEGLFGYQTSSSNLCGFNLNISVSCRLSHRKRVREKELWMLIPFLTTSQEAWPLCSNSNLLIVDLRVKKGLKYEQVGTCQDVPILLTNIQFFQIHKTWLGSLSEKEKGVKAGFPIHRFICCWHTTNRFPQLMVLAPVVLHAKLSTSWLCLLLTKPYHKYKYPVKPVTKAWTLPQTCS